MKRKGSTIAFKSYTASYNPTAVRTCTYNFKATTMHYLCTCMCIMCVVLCTLKSGEG